MFLSFLMTLSAVAQQQGFNEAVAVFLLRPNVSADQPEDAAL